ncbi:MAG: hypothetical protein EZS28_024352, partial [Streblomastix strix]
REKLIRLLIVLEPAGIYVSDQHLQDYFRIPSFQNEKKKEQLKTLRIRDDGADTNRRLRFGSQSNSPPPSQSQRDVNAQSDQQQQQGDNVNKERISPSHLSVHGEQQDKLKQKNKLNYLKPTEIWKIRRQQDINESKQWVRNSLILESQGFFKQNKPFIPSSICDQGNEWKGIGRNEVIMNNKKNYDEVEKKKVKLIHDQVNQKERLDQKQIVNIISPFNSISEFNQ